MKNKENKILEEFLENFPGINIDKKNLEKIIKIIKDNNPEINIDKNFKQKLKSRLDSIIEFKENKKVWFFSSIFLVPVFSVFLIVWWIFYVYKDVSLLKQDNLNYKNIEILDSEVDNILEVLEEKEIKLQRNKEVIIDDSPVIPFHKGAENIKAPSVLPDISLNEGDKNIEDNQIIEILWESIPESLNSVIEETMLYDNWVSEPYINSFVDYCEEYSSEIFIDKSWNQILDKL